MPHHHKLTVLYLPCKTLEEGRFIARTLLTEGLIACANLIPAAISLFQWEGAIQEQNEIIMICKTIPSRLTQASQRICTLHSYSTPLVLEIPAYTSHIAMFTWIKEATEEPQ